MSTPELHVVFRVGRTEYAVPASHVAQLESYSGATPVPGAARHVAGVVQIRGRVIPVIDLRVRFGLDPEPPTPDSRVVVAALGERRVGLLADRAREVVRIDPDRIEAPPPMVAAESGGLVCGIARLDPRAERVVMLVDLPKVVGEERADGE